MPNLAAYFVLFRIAFFFFYVYHFPAKHWQKLQVAILKFGASAIITLCEVLIDRYDAIYTNNQSTHSL